MCHSHDCRSRVSDGSGSLTVSPRGTVRCDLDLINGTTVTTARHQRGRFAACHSRDVHRRCGYALANKGHDTRAIQGWLGHRSITSTAVYTALQPSSAALPAAWAS